MPCYDGFIALFLQVNELKNIVLERISASTKVYDQFIQKETRDTPQLITESDDVEKEDKKELADAIDDPEAEKERYSLENHIVVLTC